MSIEEFPKIYSLKSALKNIERKNNKISNYKGIAYEESNFEKPNSEENNFKIKDTYGNKEIYNIMKDLNKIIEITSEEGFDCFKKDFIIENQETSNNLKKILKKEYKYHINFAKTSNNNNHYLFLLSKEKIERKNCYDNLLFLIKQKYGKIE